jgi:hypothetical protein
MPPHTRHHIFNSVKILTILFLYMFTPWHAANTIKYHNLLLGKSKIFLSQLIREVIGMDFHCF